MIQKKTNRKQVFLQNIRDLTNPIAGKPALAASLTVMAVYASLDAPLYAIFLLIPVAFATHFFPKSVQWCILGALVTAVACHSLLGGKRYSSPTGDVPASACGNIEAVLPRGNGTAFIVKVTGSTVKEGFANKEGAQPRVRITEKRDMPELPEPGDSICFEAKWYPVSDPTVPGAFNTREWLASQGFAAYGKFVHWNAWQGKWIPERSFYAFRKWIKGRFEEYLEPAETGLLLGLLAGDRSGIPEALRNDFQRSGLVHVLAISGFHVVLLAGTPKENVVFHVQNDHLLPMDDILSRLHKDDGTPLDYVEQDEFLRRFDAAKEDPEKSQVLSSIIAYTQAEGQAQMVENEASNVFSMQVLHRLGFRWDATSRDYVDMIFDVLSSMQYFG